MFEKGQPIAQGCIVHKAEVKFGSLQPFWEGGVKLCHAGTLDSFGCHYSILILEYCHNIKTLLFVKLNVLDWKSVEVLTPC